MADAPDSKSGPRKRVWVQVPPSDPGSGPPAAVGPPGPHRGAAGRPQVRAVGPFATISEPRTPPGPASPKTTVPLRARHQEPRQFQAGDLARPPEPEEHPTHDPDDRQCPTRPATRHFARRRRRTNPPTIRATPATITPRSASVIHRGSGRRPWRHGSATPACRAPVHDGLSPLLKNTLREWNEPTTGSRFEYTRFTTGEQSSGRLGVRDRVAQFATNRCRSLSWIPRG